MNGTMILCCLGILSTLIPFAGAFTSPSSLVDPRVAPVPSYSHIYASMPTLTSLICASIKSIPPTPTALFMVPYIPPEETEVTQSKIKLPKPKIGDIVRYYDIDGGQATGQVLVGKISLIQAIRPSSSSTTTTSQSNADGTNKWLVEITEMEDVGDGYYAEYPSRKRRKSALRKLEEIAPLPASFVRSEDAFKIPMERGTNRPLPSHVGYNLVDYEGPKAVSINQDVVQADSDNYQQIKLSLLRNAAIAGAAGTVGVDLFRGTEDAIIYAAGALAGVAYLFFLGIKTDTLGGTDSKLGANVSNLRFVFPALVVGGVAVNNVLRGDANPVSSPGLFSTVTPEQFGAAMIGFLTYRVPLFVSQLSPVVSDSASDMIPGSAGMALQMAADAKKRGIDMSSLNNSLSSADNLVTVLLISGPEGTGKTTLVNKLLEQDNRFVRPILLDRISDAVKFERLEQRGELLDTDASGRYALSREGVLEAAAKATSESGTKGDMSKKVVVVDADVTLARQLVNLSGARLIGVWIGLDDLEKFESRLKAKIASGGITIPDDETKESILRAKVRQVVKDIEYGVVSG